MIITIDVQVNDPDTDRVTARILDAVEDQYGVISVDVIKVED